MTKRLTLRLPDELAPLVKQFASEAREIAKKDGLSYGTSPSFPSSLLGPKAGEPLTEAEMTQSEV